MARKAKSYDVAHLRKLVRSASPVILADHTTLGHRYRREDTGRKAWSVTTKLGFVNKGYLHKWYAKRAAEHVRDNLPRLLQGDLSVLDEAARAGEGSRDNAADIGTNAHGAIDRFVTEWLRTGVRPSGSASLFLADGAKGEEIAACRSFDRLIDTIEYVPIASEIKVWYEYGRDCFAGTVDTIFILRHPYKDRIGDPTCAHDYSAQPSGVLWCTKCHREVTERLILGDWKSSNSIVGKEDYSQQDTAYAKAIEKATGLKFDELWVVRLDKYKAFYEICEVTDRNAAWKEFLTISRAFDEREKRNGKSLLEPINKREVIKI